AVVVGRVVVVVARRAVVAVRRIVVDETTGLVELDGATPPATWNDTRTTFDTTSRPTWSVGAIGGAPPCTTYASSTLSTSMPNRGLALTHVAHTSVVPSDCFDTLTIWNRSARLADGPPSEESVVDRERTR